MRTTTIRTAAAAAAALALTACSTPGGDESVPGVTDDTVTIGTHQPLTGPAAAGYSTISAATAAYFAYVNDNGGIHGRSIEYVVKDDAYDPAATQTAVRELVTEEKVFAVVNGLGTPTHSSVLDYLDQQGVPDLFVSSGSLTWNQPGVYENTFAFNADYVTEGAALAQYAVEQAPDAKICVLGQDDDYGEGIVEGVETVIGSNAVTEVQTYTTSAEDLTAQTGAMMAAGCEVNVLGTINGFTAMAVGTAAQMEWFPKWYVSSSGADYPTLAGYLGEDLAPALLQGMVSVNYLPFSPDGEWVALFERINEEYNDGAPFTGNTVFGMSVGYLFAEALAAAGEDPTRESLVDAVESGDLLGNGILPLSYGADDHAAYRGVGITVVDEGVQDYVGTAYEVSGGAVAPVEPSPVPLENEGIPG
ncbi:ABC transporter substrate-binding protein [Glycomyces sp. A-F 0318]|uniref:ABC transporter substrate-binding protein n=1 Tax=Glycomyces amatae TaxID=2881355 RepID=UPI001E59344E|nr:ABC transporter substrate-binding protein [Glycomyces amatae]MCD0445689.1 ABC transporter substrate-binding protein [Glycomyces amatae]